MSLDESLLSFLGFQLNRKALSPASETASNDLVGNQSSQVTHSDLMNLFSKQSNLLSVTAPHPPRNYAFVCFDRIEDAKATVEGLRGTILHRSAMQINFAKTHFQSSGEKEPNGHPSNVLWIGFPPSVCIDERMLRNAMIFFGEIETIRSSPSQNYSCIEFRSVDEARRAKEGLQGHIFNDPRILIMYLSNDVGRSKVYAGFPPGTQWPRTDVLFTEPPYRTSHMDMSSHDLYMTPNAPSGHEPYSDMLRKLPDANPNSLMGGQNWRRPSPAPAMLPSPSLRMKRPIGPVSGAWDAMDVSQLQREPKRSRIETVLPVFGSSFPSKALEDRPLGSDQLGHQDHDYLWRGVIAKGGTSVCRGRCVPIRKGIKSEIPDVVNCSAKTGLDMLAKHCTEAMGCTVVYFLPDCEEDFGSYTAFLQYLLKNNQAEVAQFDDGTALFFVPPSEFLSKVLNVNGPERLYGVVLKSPHHNRCRTFMQPQSQSQYLNSQQKHCKIESSGMPQKEEKDLQMDCNMVLRNDSLHLTKQLAHSTTGSLQMPVNTLAIQSRVNLAPVVSSSMRPLLLLKPDLDRGLLPQGSKFDFQGNKLTTHQFHEAENQFNPQGQFSQLQTDTSSLNSSPMITGNPQFQDPKFNLPQQGAVSCNPCSTFGIPSQSGQHQHRVPENFDKDFRIVQGTDSLGSYGSSSCQQHENSVTMSNQVYDSSVAQTYTAMPLAADKGKSVFWKVPQSAGDGASQGTSGVEDEKSQRLLYTLQLAADKLKQQQASTQAGQWSANPVQDFHQLALSIFWKTKLDGQPHHVLWIGYPPSVRNGEQLLHNTMLIFGEVETIRSFPPLDYSCVEFRSVDDAWREKEGLRCYHFNDPKISIMNSSSDVGPTEDYSGFHP